MRERERAAATHWAENVRKSVMTSRKNSGTAANSTGTFSGSGREGLERKGLTEESSERKGLTERTYGRQRVNRVYT